MEDVVPTVIRLERNLEYVSDVCSRQESNLHCRLRKPMSYPLNDESVLV